MGADSFIAFYGLKYMLADAELDAIERGTDHRIIGARRAKLQTHFGRPTDGEPYFLLIGTRLAVLGIQSESERSLDSVELQQTVRDTVAKLEAAGLDGAPKLHLQLEAQY